MKTGLKRKARKAMALLLTLTMLVSCLGGLSALAAPSDVGASRTLPELKLWYDEPSTETGTPGGMGAQVYNQDQNIWQQDSMPIGSGDLGANVYGEIAMERITLNEKTLWTQGPTEKDPTYNGGNLINNGRNGAALKEVETYFKENPDAVTVPSSMLNSFLGQWQGYGYYAPWGELQIAYPIDLGEAEISKEFAATSTSAKNSKFTWSSGWYTYNDGDGSHQGPAKVESNTDGDWFTYDFTVPAGKTCSLELNSDTSGGGGTLTLELTKVPAGFTKPTPLDVTVGGKFYTFSNLTPGDYTVKGAWKSGKLDLDFVRLVSYERPATNFQRWLSLDNAVTGVEFTQNGVTYTREFLASHPDSVIAGKLTSTGGTMDLTITLPKGGDMDTDTVAVADDTLKLAGAVTDNDMKYNSYLKVVPKDGSVTKNSSNDGLVVTGATEVALYFTAATDYKMVYPVYRTGETDAELDARVKAVLDAAVTKGYDVIKTDHVADYHSLYNRMSLDLGQTSTTKTTDQLLKAYNAKTATEGERRLLEVMLFQYGRYLMISSSREDSQLPANLQGVWNNRSSPTWNSDYHINVNLQMNYWPVYNTNLTECVEPLVKFVEGLRIPGRITAEVYAGTKSTPEDPEAGFMSHTQTTPFGWTCPGYAFSWGWSPASTPWILQNVWERYEYTGDLNYMRNYIYPMLKEECRLYDAMLLNIGTEEEPVLISAPAYSPEHGPQGTAGNTYEHSLIWQLYADTITAANLLGVDADYVETWTFNRDHLRGPIEIGASGQIKEWYHEVEFNKDKNGNSLGEGFGHRHLSHMLGLYPGDLVQTRDDWFEAARVSMENRSDSATGWGTAERINTWARLRDGNRCLRIINALFKTGIYNNLWDAHPPFQIDGNFGYTSAVAEMLLQSNMGFIDLLPALPDEWASGRYQGMLARGNFEMDVTWSDHLLTRAAITSKNGGKCAVYYPNISGAKVTDAAGNLIEFEIVDNDKISFNTAKGATYTITEIPEAAEQEPGVVENAAAYRVSESTVELRWTAEEGKSYQVYRQLGDGEVFPVGEAVTNGTFTDDTAYEALGTPKYFFSVDGAPLTTTPVTVQDLRNMGRVDDQYSLDGTSSSGSPIVFSDGWGTYNLDSTNYKGTSKFVDAADVSGQTATLTFLGTGIQAMGYRGYGTQFTMSIDGGTPQSFTVSGDNGRPKSLGEISGLEYGIHTVVMTLVANKIDFDGFNVLGGQTVAPPDEPTLEISTVGGVEKLWNAGETVIFTSNITDGVTWTATSSVTHAATCDYPEHKFSWNAETKTLTAGLTDEVVTVTATKGGVSKSMDITITPKTTVTIIEDSVTDGGPLNPDSRITSGGGGTWSPWWGEKNKHHGGSKTENSTVGAWLQLSFTGTDVAVYGTLHYNNGAVSVLLDDQVKEDIHPCGDSGSTDLAQKKLAEYTNLSNGPHTLKLTVKSANNAAGASKSNFVLDFFEVKAPNPNAPTANLDALKAAVASAAEHHENNYTAESWAPLATALETAGKYLNNTEVATQEQADAAVTAINTAISGLRSKPLDPPANLTVVQTGGTSVTVKWDAVSNADSYQVEVDGQTYSVDSTVYQITGLESARTYTVKVYSVNNTGSSTTFTSTNVTTQDTVAPDKPTNLAYAGGTLTWTASRDNVDVTGYKVSVNNAAPQTTTTNSITLSLSDGDVVKVTACDAAGNESTPTMLVIARSYTVSVNNATLEGGKTSYKAGEAVTVTADIPAGHILTGWAATGVTLEPGTKETTLHFAMPAGDVTLTANTRAQTWSIITDLTNLTVTGLPTSVAHGSSVGMDSDSPVTLVAPEPYKLPATIVVTMGGVVQQAPWVVYSSVDGTIKIHEVTGDIVITAENAIQTPEGDAFTESDPFGLPSELGETTKLQAEYMELTDGASAVNGPGFNNQHITGFVDGATLKLYYNAPVAGTYTMVLNYKSGRNVGNEHTLGWNGDDDVTEYAVKAIPNTLEGSTGVYQSHEFDFTVNTARSGLVTFTTTSTGDGPELDWATFTLKSSTSTTNNITDISLTPTTKTLYTNEEHADHTVYLVPTVEPSDSRETIVWTSSDPEVAYVEQSGKVTARAAGTTTITAVPWHEKDNAETTLKATATITVKAELSGRVTIVPEAKYDSELTADTHNILPFAARDTLTYQWKLDGAEISGATDRTYTPKASDITHELSVVVSGAEPYEGSVESAPVVVGKADGTKLSPETPTHVDCSADGVEDGKITGLTCGQPHQYKQVSDTDADWKRVEANVSEITGLAPGSYHVRHAETDTHTVGPVSETVTIMSAADSPNALAINIPSMAGGRVTASTRRALKGADVTLTVAPETGYTYNEDLGVTNATDLSEGTANGDGTYTYTFTMPSQAVDVSASFTIIQYDITDELEHITCDLTTHKVDHGTMPTPITLTPKTGYELTGVNVKVYTKASVEADPNAPVEFAGIKYRLNDDGSGVITFEQPVTEDLVVKGAAVLKTYQVYYQIPGLSAVGQPRTVQHGKGLAVTLSPADSHASLPEEITLSMGGVLMTGEQFQYENGSITIDEGIITGDIIIDAVGGSTLPALTGVTVEGIPSEGQRLEAVIVPADATVTYQWMRVKNGVAVAIEDATTSRYLLSADDVGATIKVRVTGTGEFGGTIESEETETVDNAPVVETTGVTLNKTTTDLTVGTTMQLTATVLPADATNKSVRWSSSDESVATVVSGLVRGLKPGTATITVTTVNGNKQATCVITVVAISLPKTATVAPEKTITLTPTIPDDLANKDITWTSDNEEIATVDENGVVTGVAVGKATITATTGAGYTASCEVTVKTPSTSSSNSSSRPTTSTEVKEDGTKVTTETKPDGTKVETTETPDGAKEVVETKKDGTVTATTETPDGTKAVVETKPDGSKNQIVEQADGTKSEMAVSKEGDVTISVTDAAGEELVKTEIPAVIPEPEAKFEDVTDAAPWAEEAVNKVAGLELVKGTGGNKYSPVAPMTRGSLATVLHRLSQGKTDYNNTFKDVAQGKFYTEGVAWAAKANVVKGVSEDIFAPEKTITREQLAVMLARYAKLVGLDTKADAAGLEKFADGEKTGTWAVDGVAWCVENGILKGKSGNALDPTADVTRAEVAVMLDRFISLLK